MLGLFNIVNIRYAKIDNILFIKGFIVLVLDEVKQRKIGKDFQVQYRFDTPNLELMNAFVFQADKVGLHLFYMINSVVARHYCIPFEDKNILLSMLKQKVMRIEEVKPDGQVFELIAINQRLVSKDSFTKRDSAA